MARPLTDKQRLFVYHYLGRANRNAAEAARLAGYKWPDKQGPQALAKTSVRTQVSREVTEAGLDAAEVVAKLACIACQDIRHYGALLACRTMEEAKVELERLGRLGLTYPIKSVEPNRHGAPVVRFEPKYDALVRLGQSHSLWAEKVKLDLSDDEMDKLGPEELWAIARGRTPERMPSLAN